MGHKADDSFFDKKRPWSERKDAILQYYLKPYLAKVAKLRRPILIVDGFAGRGKFRDGQDGSPLIICQKALEAHRAGTEISVRCVEPDEHRHQTLQENLRPFPFAQAVRSDFADDLPKIEALCRKSTVFLYIDPWVVHHLEWAPLDTLFKNIGKSEMSLEVLLNFSAPQFVRCGLAALQRQVPSIDASFEDADELDMPVGESPSLERLNKIVDGTWWRSILTTDSAFPDQVERIAAQLCGKLRERFGEAGYLAIRARDTHRVPKYHLLFASRSVDGLVLMNDAMVNSCRQKIYMLDLFSEEEREELILARADHRVARGALIANVIRSAFCRHSWKEIRGTIERLLKAGKLKSESGRPRINDQTKIWRT